ncbi:UDP-N-acetylglucosamine 2-epimerase (non-hydrolyzing) [Paenibacillus lautus]|jgi:UDP-N-acetylglucosamine 2-epimerase (non-hydrolysing)|uniref:UDP-N-acetylglucosamine 2-epimerase (Non-hydrolyzing) n=1 Tax=Paenibacillus lautus TaxID=1401 RepID=A0A385TQM7_PAELA|nr:UDP-N-acetylglucosamine 2-epimerase (non-hydrolyzing) [Paenibacillus lautus]AYB45873.1 UDP-N-acetylglucosamine 2-epimerase (non-hydrolyzing) [Paenibacillus lautus]MCI1775904.1 UDP-N-acetylglucosamine 2-epimerase (non-hydrolyzing) [Paenibacillus lautus]VTR22450.1 UDP-N-acetyl glucosamine-2-epimerase [Actinobacillus pleuropneumoniae]
MKVMTILGTRPEIIRLSLIIPLLDQYATRHVLVHTGQNFTNTLSGVFFSELGLRSPDYVLQDRQATLGGQLAVMFSRMEEILEQEQPDTVLLLGDTNSALCAVLAERLGYPVVHMEAGNRCFDLDVPEEKNRKVIDAVSSINMPYTSYSKNHLLREGVPSQRIVQTGNPIYEVMKHYEAKVNQSRIMEKLSLSPQQYFLVTIHRSENVDRPENLMEILNGLNAVAETFGHRLICSLHPRTASRLEGAKEVILHPLIEFHEPFGFFDFVRLEKDALCAITDSGTVQEECCIMHVPTVTVRRTTERPETVDCGSNIVSGLNAERIHAAVTLMTRLNRDWKCPEGYLADNVSRTVVKYVLGGKVNVH